MTDKKTAIVISAVDKTGDAVRSVTGGLNQISETAGRVTGAVSGLAAAAGVSLFAAMIRESIATTAALKDLSETTGASVEGLSAIRQVARLSETDLGSVGSGLQKLAKNMAAVDEEGSDASRAVSAIGLDAKRLKEMKPDEAMLEIAKAMAEYRDGTDKTAIAMAIFGKAGANLLPMLNDLAEKGQIHADRTAEQGEMADRFEKNLIQLSHSGEAWKTELTNNMLPALSSFSDIMLDAMNGTGGLRDEIRSLGEDGTINEWTSATINGLTYLIDVVEGAQTVFAQFGRSLAVVFKDVATVAEAAVTPWDKQTELWAEREAFVKAANEDMDAHLSKPLIGQKLREAFAASTEAKKKALDDYKKEVQQVTAAYSMFDDSILNAALLQVYAKYNPDSPLLKGKVKYTPTAPKVDAAKGDDLKPLLARLDNTDVGLSASYTKELEILHKAYQSGRLNIDAYTGAVGKLVREQKIYKDGLKAQEEQQKRENDRIADAIEAEQKATQTILDGTASIRQQTEELGLNGDELLRLKLSRVDDQITQEEWRLSLMGGADALGLQADAIRETIAALKDRKDAMTSQSVKQAAENSAKEAMDEWKRGWTETDRLSRQVFTSWATEGGNAAEQIGKSLKTALLSAIYEATLKPLVLQLYTSGTQALGVTSSLGGVGNLASAGNSAYNLYSGGYANFSTGAIGQAMGLSSTTTIPGYTAAEASRMMAGVQSGSMTTGNAATTTAFGETVGSYVPLIGAGLSAYGVANRIGGVGGMAAGTLAGAGTIAAGGALSGAMAGTGAMAGASSALAAIPVYGWIALAAIAAYSAFAGKGGGPKTEGDFFGVMDASGAFSKKDGLTGGNGDWYTAHNADAQMEALAPALGKSIFETVKALGGTSEGVGVNFGYNTDPKGTAPDNVASAVTDKNGNYVYYNTRNVDRGNASDAMQLEMQRMTIAAVKVADGIKPIFKELVAGIEVTTASAETLTQIINDVSSIKAIGDAFTTIGLNADDLSISLIKTAGGAQTLASSLESYYANYFTDEEKAKKLSAETAKVFADVGLSMPSTREAFRTLVEGLDYTTAAGEATFAALMKVAPSFAQVADAIKETQQELLDEVTAAQNNVVNAYREELSIKQALVDKMKGYVTSLKSLREQLALGDLSPLSPYAKYQQATQKFDELKTRVKLGDTGAWDELQSFSQSFLQASKDFNATNDQYVSDFNDLQDTLQSAQDIAERQTNIAQQAVNLAQSQLTALGEIETATLSVESSINALRDAVLASLAAGGKITGTTLSTAFATSGAAIDAAYKKYLGREVDTTGSAYWQSQIASGSSLSDVVSGIANSREAQIGDLYESLLGRAPDAGGLNDWYNSGMSVDAIAAAIKTSTEYVNGSHAGGLSVVPFDGYIARTHKDEAIVDAPFMAGLRRYGIPLRAESDGGNKETVAAIRSQNLLMQQLIAAVEASQPATSADIRSMKQHLAYVLSKAA